MPDDGLAWAELDGWAVTVAASLVRLIDHRLPEMWTRFNDGPGMWRWECRTDEVCYGVAVNGCDDAKMVVPYHGWPAKVGPTVMAYRSRADPLVSVTMGNLADFSDIKSALDVLGRYVPHLGSDR